MSFARKISTGRAFYIVEVKEEGEVQLYPFRHKEELLSFLQGVTNDATRLIRAAHSEGSSISAFDDDVTVHVVEWGKPIDVF